MRHRKRRGKESARIRVQILVHLLWLIERRSCLFDLVLSHLPQCRKVVCALLCVSLCAFVYAEVFVFACPFVHVYSFTCWLWTPLFMYFTPEFYTTAFFFKRADGVCVPQCYLFLAVAVSSALLYDLTCEVATASDTIVLCGTLLYTFEKQFSISGTFFLSSTWMRRMTMFQWCKYTCLQHGYTQIHSWGLIYKNGPINFNFQCDLSRITL